MNTFLLLLILSSETIYLNGHIKGSPKENIVIFVREEHKVLAKTRTNSKGDFSLTFNTGRKPSDFFYVTAGNDTLLLASVKTFESETPDMTFSIPPSYKKNTAGEVVCPKCGKAARMLNARYYCEEDRVKF